MNNLLEKKQKMKQEDWLKAIRNIEHTVKRDDLDKRIDQTIKEIKQTTYGKKAAYAWSGGKDSIVLGILCEMAGIKDCVLVVCNLEYKEFIEWVKKNKPEKLTIENTDQDLNWLAAHPQMLFPQDSKTAAQWFHRVQHQGQAKYYKKNNLDILLLGRRRADGNYVGNGKNSYTNKQGITRYSPLADWSHEEILAYIHYYSVELPPLYAWKNGYLCGTHPWAARQWTRTVENGWREVYEIDNSIVIEAAKFFSSAKEFLEHIQRRNS